MAACMPAHRSARMPVQISKRTSIHMSTAQVSSDEIKLGGLDGADDKGVPFMVRRLYIGIASASPTACLSRGKRCTHTQKERLGKSFPILASPIFFGNFSGHADGERRGLDRIGG